MFKGFSICAHTVAAAQYNGHLESFVKWYVTTKCRPNLASIALERIEKVVGRKGGVSKRKRQPQVPIESSSPRFTDQDNCEPNSKHLTVTSTGIVTSCTSIMTVIPPTPLLVSSASPRIEGQLNMVATSTITAPLLCLLHGFKILQFF